jgi:hypothetical protein
MSLLDFQQGRATFERPVPGSIQVIDTDSAWGKIKSVETEKCFDLDKEKFYPLTKECSPIKDLHDQAWHFTSEGHLQYLDVDKGQKLINLAKIHTFKFSRFLGLFPGFRPLIS